MNTRTFVSTRSRPQRFSDRVEWKWVLAYYAARFRGWRTARAIHAQRAAMEQLRETVWLPPQEKRPYLRA